LPRDLTPPVIRYSIVQVERMPDLTNYFFPFYILKKMSGYLPIISINPKIAHKLDIAIELRKLYYRPQGYYRTTEKLRDACKKAGNNFSLVDVRGWLDKQALHQIHKPRPKFIPCASFNNITVPMEVIQVDLCYMPHDKFRGKVYKFALNCVDVASRTKWTYPLTDRDSASVAKGLEKLFNSRKCPLTWPKKQLMVDKG